MRTVAALVTAILFIAPTYGLTPPAPDTRPGPIGWEKRVTAGFDPPIEYVLVFGTQWLDPNVRPEECVGKWGPGAAPVLIKLYREPEWVTFQEKILDTIGSIAAPETKEFLLKEYADTLARSNPTPEDRNRVSRFLGYIRKVDPGRADQLVEEGLKDPSGPHFQTFAYDLMNRASKRENTGAKERLQQLLKSLPEDNPVRKSITESQKGDKSVQRANEPMSVVLDKEKGGKR